MKHYDPEKQPIPAEWLALDEGDRLRLVELYHRVSRIRLPNLRLHAAIHAVVENQLALDEQPIVRNSLNRLLSEVCRDMKHYTQSDPLLPLMFTIF